MGSRKRDSAEAMKEAKKDIAFAKLNNVPTSPRKMRLVADIIRGEDVNKALYILKYSKKEASERLEKLVLSAILGIGTALVYPTFLATIAEVTSPKQRAESIGTFRLWRDLGYAFGAVLSGLIADAFGVEYAVLVIGLLTLMSSFVVQFRMPKV